MQLIKRIVKQSTGFGRGDTLEQQQEEHVILHYGSTTQNLIKIGYESHGPGAGSVLSRLCRAICSQPGTRSTCLANAPTQVFTHRYPNLLENPTFLQSMGVG